MRNRYSRCKRSGRELCPRSPGKRRSMPDAAGARPPRDAPCMRFQDTGSLRSPGFRTRPATSTPRPWGYAPFIQKSSAAVLSRRALASSWLACNRIRCRAVPRPISSSAMFADTPPCRSWPAFPAVRSGQSVGNAVAPPGFGGQGDPPQPVALSSSARSSPVCWPVRATQGRAETAAFSNSIGVLATW